MRRYFPDPLRRRGSAAVEFAVFVPLLLIFLMGTVEMATLYRTSAKLNAVVANVANAIAASQAVTATALSTPGSPQATVAAGSPATSFTSGAELVQEVSLPDLCKGAALGTAPYPNGGMTLDIASVTEESTTGPTYDFWEYDQTVAPGPSCSPAGTTVILPTTAGTTQPAASGAAWPAAITPLMTVPCDNVIIVRATLPYSGIFGLFLTSSVTLTQTAYSRWAIAQPQTELMCAGCTIPGGAGTSVQTPGAGQVCISTNTATN